MNDLTSRQKVIMAVTIVIMLGALAFRMGWDKEITDLVSGAASEDRYRKEFRENLEVLEDLVVVERRYNSLGQSPLDAMPEDRPLEEFVFKMAKDNGFDFPQFSTEVEEIEGASEYEFQMVSIRTEGPFDNTMNLLKQFDNNGLLLREVDLRSTQDRDSVVSRVTVARIARRQGATIAGGSGLFNE